MPLTRFILLVAAVAGLAACGPDASPPALQYGTITGIITDAATNRPIAGALVSTVDRALSSTPSDAGGKYTFSNVPIGPVDYVVSAPNYASSSGTVNMPPNGKLQVNAALTHQ